MRIEIIDDPDVRLDEAWDPLARAAGTPNIFYERWMVRAARGLPEGAGMRLLLGWTGDRLDALLPVQPHRVLGGRVTAALQNWDQRVRSLGEPLIRDGSERAFWDAALDSLDRGIAPGRYLRLSTLVADSASTIALRAVLAERGRAAHVTRSFARAKLSGGVASAEYVAANIRKKVLKEHRRLRNRLADRGGLAFERLNANAEAGPWIDALFALELTGWKGRDGVAAAADATTETAFRTILTQAHRLGRLDFHRLVVAGKPIAMLANIEATGDTAFQLKIAYDEAEAAFSPGVLIEMEYLVHALDRRGLAMVDSCARPGHPMIDRIWVDRLPIVSLAIPFDRVSSRALCGTMAAVRAWRSRHAVPEPVSA